MFLTTPSGPRPKAAVPHPALWLVAQAASLLVRPPTAEALIWVIAPCASPPAATPDFGETFQFSAVRQRLRKCTFTVFFNINRQSGRTENPCIAD